MRQRVFLRVLLVLAGVSFQRDAYSFNRYGTHQANALYGRSRTSRSHYYSPNQKGTVQNPFRKQNEQGSWYSIWKENGLWIAVSDSGKRYVYVNGAWKSPDAKRLLRKRILRTPNKPTDLRQQKKSYDQLPGPTGKRLAKHRPN